MDWQQVLWAAWMVVFTPIFLLFKILYWPVSTLFSIILVLLSPVFYTIQCCLVPFVYLYNILPRAQPIYVFFGSAAFVGMLAGIALLLTSTVVTSITGKHYDERDDRRGLSKGEGSTGTATPVKRLDEAYSSQESDWQWLGKAPDSRRRRTPGLLAQTILEEDDDS